jgi:hypothetical protein
MEKLDLTKKFKEYYSAKPSAEKVSFGQIPYLTILGKGEPAGKEFSEKAGAIYPVAYAVKKICKETIQDFGVPKLEGLWWVNDQRPALEVPRSEWYWKLLIRMPDFVTIKIFEKAIAEVIKKKTSIASEVKFEIIDEGELVSILHIGSYKTEPGSIRKMDDYINSKGLTKNGLHHEIYLSDPNKSEPDKLKTILRQPVK